MLACTTVNNRTKPGVKLLLGHILLYELEATIPKIFRTDVHNWLSINIYVFLEIVACRLSLINFDSAKIAIYL